MFILGILIIVYLLLLFVGWILDDKAESKMYDDCLQDDPPVHLAELLPVAVGKSLNIYIKPNKVIVFMLLVLFVVLAVMEVLATQ